MKIQSLSIVVPAKKCVNNCKFCVSKMHESEYENMITSKNLYYDLYKKDFMNRLEFARDNGCNTVMLTGDCEPLQNRKFLEKFGDYNQALDKPFRIVEIQTAGNLLTNDYLYFLRHHVGVTTISLSLSSFFDEMNAQIIGCDEFSLNDLCERIKKYRFNLRLSLNVSKQLLPENKSISVLFTVAKSTSADQLTFRKLYSSGENGESDWVHQNQVPESFWDELKTFVQDKGTLLEQLEYGLKKYDVSGMSTVIDDDCMSTEARDAMKYLILRENCKLYSKWSTKGSLIF